MKKLLSAVTAIALLAAQAAYGDEYELMSGNKQDFLVPEDLGFLDSPTFPGCLNATVLWAVVRRLRRDGADIKKLDDIKEIQFTSGEQRCKAIVVKMRHIGMQPGHE